MFYSYCYWHGGPVPGGTEYRAEVASRGIDDFVLRMATATAAPYQGDYGTGCQQWEKAGNVRQRYERLVRLSQRGNGTLLRFDRMKSDLKNWLEEFAKAVGVRDSFLAADLTKLDFRKGGQPVDLKERFQVPTTDYNKLLKKETITTLDQIFDFYFDIDR